jgi:hypothetical protein
MFGDIEDFRVFVKRASNLLPEYSKDITPASLRKVKEDYIAMQRDTMRKRLSADVEIKVGNMASLCAVPNADSGVFMS